MKSLVDIRGDCFELGVSKHHELQFGPFSAKLTVKHQMQYSVLLQMGIKILDSQWRKILNQQRSYVWLVLPEDSWTIKTGSNFEMQWRFAFLLSSAERITNESANQPIVYFIHQPCSHANETSSWKWSTIWCVYTERIYQSRQWTFTKLYDPFPVVPLIWPSVVLKTTS